MSIESMDEEVYYWICNLEKRIKKLEVRTRMKFYLASAFKYTKEVKLLAQVLEKKGHTITCQWWHQDFKELPIKNDDEWYSKPIIRTIYLRSFHAIEDADILIIVSPERTKFNGANVEVGIALGLRKPVICFGEIERSGMYEPLIRCPTLEDLKKVLFEFEER